MGGESAQVLVSAQSRVLKGLERALERRHGLAPRLFEAMQYAVLNGGKRVRPALAYAAAQSCGGDLARADAAAVAVELLHCFSLVHDDLPCMDDDDLRRGVPTCHRQFDEATALLAGDALQSLAFSVLAGSGLPAPVIGRQVAILAQASVDMVVGQTLDLEAEGQQPDLDALETIHRHKTGALIRASVALGALAVSATDAQCAALDTYADRLGLAFQVQDDVLDVIGDSKKTGKHSGMDAMREKATYPALLGLAGAQRLAGQLHDEALAALQPLGPNALPLRQLAGFLVSRDH